MADAPPPRVRRPGLDEIVVSTPAGRHLCNSLACRNIGKLADVIVTYGQLGSNWWDKDALWPNCWGRSYPLCNDCWQRSHKVAEASRPKLVITGET